MNTETVIKKVFLTIVVICVPVHIFAQEWKVVDRSGSARFVYLAPEGLKDKQFVAQVLHAVMVNEVGLDRKTGRWRGTVQIMFFDNKRYTAHGFPMTDKQMHHYKARYNYNSSTNFEEFVWISVANATASPPKLKEIKDRIRPGIVE
jgi:hypothetical protein